MSLKSDETEQLTLNQEYGFEGDIVEDYTTITGKEYKDMQNATGYNIKDFEIGNTVSGYPEVTIYDNDEKDEKGEYKKKSQSIKLRIIDGEDEYVDLYANIPRRDKNGFVENINKSFNFMRSGFDLCFSFMHWVDETNVIAPNGEEINNIRKINIEKICEKIDTMDYVNVKIIKSKNPEYPSWILLDMKNI